MKLKYVTGCTCFSTTIDGEELVDLNSEIIKNSLHKMIDKINDEGILQNVFIDLLCSIGELKSSDHPCEQCGDYIDIYTLEL